MFKRLLAVFAFALLVYSWQWWFLHVAFLGFFAFAFFHWPFLFAPMWLREFWCYVRDEPKQSIVKIFLALLLICFMFWNTNLVIVFGKNHSLPHFTWNEIQTPLLLYPGAFTMYTANFLKWILLNLVLNWVIPWLTPSKQYERAFAKGLLYLPVVCQWSRVTQLDADTVRILSKLGATLDDYRKASPKIENVTNAKIKQIRRINLQEFDIEIVRGNERKFGELIEAEDGALVALPYAASYVYIIGNGGYCKIGHGKSVNARLDEAARWIPQPRVLFAAPENGNITEKKLHRLFRASKIIDTEGGQELFRLSGEILKFIEDQKHLIKNERGVAFDVSSPNPNTNY